MKQKKEKVKKPKAKPTIEKNAPSDKIFNNSFEAVEFNDGSTISFKVDPAYESTSYEDKVDYYLAAEKIDVILDTSKYAKWVVANNKPNGLTKADINEVYIFTKRALPKLSNVEIYSYLCDYFAVNPSKFYNSLSNSFKTELIEELRRRGVLNKKESLF